MSPENLLNFIDGDFKAPIGGAYIPSYNPSTGKVINMIPDSDGADVEMAVASAAKAFPAWSSTSREHRSALLYKLADLLEGHLQQFAEAESRDQGKTVKQALTLEIPRAVKNLRFFAGAALQFKEQASSMEGLQSYSLTAPVGMVGLISPWNLPLYLLTWKLAPALASTKIPECIAYSASGLTAYMLCKLIDEVGFPPGVVNLVFGLGAKAGEALVRHPKVRAISFTGGTLTGRRIQEAAAQMTKKVSLELGGKNANVIFADCDWDAMLSTTLRSSFANQGEICLCGSRILVERSCYDRFLADFVPLVQSLQVGDPASPSTFMGALVSDPHMAKVKSYVELAKSEGCKVLTGDEPFALAEPFTNGYFLRPAVITNVSLDSRLMKEEIFGPVVCVVPFDSEQQAVEIANDTEYGLSASVWTSDVKRAQRLAAQIEVGTVWVNCWMMRDLSMPFGGVKASGVGREGGDYSLEFFSEVRTVSLAL